jgi:hypothetical protein
MARGMPHGGWCPKGRCAEDGPISVQYQLQETPSADPAQRTEWNVRDSDGTVIFSINENLTGGSLLTAQLARQYHKPLLHIVKGSRKVGEGLHKFVRQHKIHILNIAGPRASKEPEIGQFVNAELDEFASFRQ